ncbi:MAG: hypothetical protein ACYSWU_08460, partial [Planctomycetota bacterium]
MVKHRPAGASSVLAWSRIETANRYTTSGLANIEGLTELRRLGLSDTQATDAGLEHLKGLTKLNVLELKNTRVTDAGVQRIQ